MNIGVFTDVYKPSINGVTSSIELFRQSLEARGHRVYVVAPEVAGEPKESNVIRLPSIEQLSPKTFPIPLPVLPTFDKQIARLNLDIVHTHQPFFIGQYGDRMAKKLGVPHIHTYHTYLTEYAHYFPVRVAEPLVRRYLRELSRSFCNRTQVVIAPSHAIKNLLLTYGVTRPIVINPTGVDLRGYHRLSSQERGRLFRAYQIPPEQKTILFGGRLAKEKNLHFLLRVFSGVARGNAGVHLIFAGGGPDEKPLKTQVDKLHLHRRVTITGYLAHEEISKFFGAADVFAFPSLTDTQGIVVCEALAGATPVVAIDAMGPRDIIEDGISGFLTEKSEVAFTGALGKLLTDDRLRARFSAAALTRAREFSLEKTTDRLLTIYQQGVDELRRTHA